MSRFWNSSKVQVMLVDLVVSLVLYFTGKYASESIAADIKFLILSMQPVFIAVITGIFVEDAALKRGAGGAQIAAQAIGQRLEVGVPYKEPVQ